MSNRHTPQTDKVYEILKRPDGSFDLFHNGELRGRSIPNKWLEDQLSEYGICGEEYRAACVKLDEVGEARLVFHTGRIRTKLRTSNNSVVRLKGI
jgi:hypothetical protein